MIRMSTLTTFFFFGDFYVLFIAVMQVPRTSAWHREDAISGFGDFYFLLFLGTKGVGEGCIVPGAICSHWHPRWWQSLRLALSPLLFNTALKTVDSATRQENKMTAIQMEKKEVKLSLFSDDIVIYTNESTKQPLALISEFIKVTGYMINI